MEKEKSAVRQNTKQHKKRKKKKQREKRTEAEKKREGALEELRTCNCVDGVFSLFLLSFFFFVVVVECDWTWLITGTYQDKIKRMKIILVYEFLIHVQSVYVDVDDM